jgi:stress-induced morphogen
MLTKAVSKVAEKEIPTPMIVILSGYLQQVFLIVRSYNNSNDEFLKSDRDKILCSHIKILVVSDRFIGLSNVERILLVYEEIVDKLGVNILPSDAPHQSGNDALMNGNAPLANASPKKHNNYVNIGRCAPSGFKLASYYGSNVCSLDLFRFLLPSKPLALIISAKTVSQWRNEKKLNAAYSSSDGKMPIWGRVDTSSEQGSGLTTSNGQKNSSGKKSESTKVSFSKDRLRESQSR